MRLIVSGETVFPKIIGDGSGSAVRGSLPLELSARIICL